MPADRPPPEPARRPRGPRPPASPLRAVLMGAAVDIAGSALADVVLSAAYAMQLRGAGLSDAELEDALRHVPPDSAVAIIGALLGALISVFAGYVCARLVRRDERRCGLALAALMAVYGLVIDGGAVDELALLFTACTVACNLLGVKFGAEHNRRVDAAAGP